jgi:hypothetical protein
MKRFTWSRFSAFKKKRYIFILVIGGLFIMFMFWVSRFFIEPNPSILIGNDNFEISNFSYVNGEEYWFHKNEQLFFTDPDSSVGIITVYTDSLPSEEKKPGRLIVSVRLPRNFNNINPECLFGLRIGNKTAPNSKKIFIGLNGEGLIQALNGNLRELDAGIEKSFHARATFSKAPLHIPYESGLNYITLTLKFDRNPNGWIVFGSFRDNLKENKRDFHMVKLNKVPYDYLNSVSKEISLIAYNPSAINHVWFKDWIVYNDWAPVD